MTITTTQINGWIAFYLWPFFRITGMLVIAPVFATRTVPVRLRLLVTVMLTLVIAPTLPPMPLLDPFTLAGMLQIANQMVIGLAMGFLLHMIFAAFAVAAQTMGVSMGLGFAMAVDPNNGVQVPVLAQLYVLIATLIFVGLNGHLMVIDTLHQSFSLMPVSSRAISTDSIWTLLEWGGMMFVWGLRIALPIVVTLLLVNISFGVVTRAAPQLNIFAVGFPVSIMVGFWLVMITFPSVSGRVIELMESAFSTVATFRLVGG